MLRRLSVVSLTCALIVCMVACEPSISDGPRVPGRTADYMPLISELPQGFVLQNEQKINQQGVDGIIYSLVP